MKKKKYLFVLLAASILVACGGGSGSEAINDDGIFGSAGAEFVDIFLTDPDEVRFKGRIFNEVSWEMEKVYPDFNVYGSINEKYREELDKKYNERLSKYDMAAIKEKWEKRMPELVKELQTIEIPTKLEEGTPLKLVSPVKLKNLDIKEYKTEAVIGCKVELTEDVAVKDEKFPLLRYMDADGNELASSGAWAQEFKNKELKKGSQIELESDFIFDRESVSKYFSANYVLLSWNTFYVEDGKLGPVQIGMSYTDLPKSVPGLYEKFDYKKEMIENELDGDYLSETCTFIKNGKEYFRAELVDGKVTAIILDENSSGLCTKEGYTPNITGLYGFYYVTEHSSYGMFSSKAIRESLDWENYNEGEVFATIGQYTFYVPSESAKTEFPSKYEDFKDNARISKIVCR